ncbi:hypothetical protein ABIE89_006972 [Bradyrhizobium niftali]
MSGSSIHLVIASAAKQSRIFPRRKSGLLRYARNDGGRAGYGCFRAFATCAGVTSGPELPQELRM